MKGEAGAKVAFAFANALTHIDSLFFERYPFFFPSIIFSRWGAGEGTEGVLSGS